MSNLTSVLAFYVNIVLCLDFATFSEEGGNEYFNMAQKKYPDNYFVYYNRGILQMKLNNYEIAIEEFDLCLKINPNFTLAKKKREKSLESIKYQFN